MSRDILSILNKSKSSVSKVVSSKAPPTQKTLNLSGIQTIKASSTSSTHTFNIIDQYLIKITPKKYDSSIDIKLKHITSFDLDGTLIQTKSNGKFARSPEDWKWFNDKVVTKLKSISSPIIIFTNQGGVVAQKTSKSYTNFIKRIELILKDLTKNGVDVNNVWILASPKKSASYKGSNPEMFSKMRKPNYSMFEELEKELGFTIDKENSIYVGDAAGRSNDFSDSDLKFAENLGIDFKTPEEYFL